MRQRRYVADIADFHTGSLQRANRGFATRTRAFHENVNATHSGIHGAACDVLRRDLRRERSAFLRPFETDSSR